MPKLSPFFLEISLNDCITCFPGLFQQPYVSRTSIPLLFFLQGQGSKTVFHCKRSIHLQDNILNTGMHCSIIGSFYSIFGFLAATRLVLWNRQPLSVLCLDACNLSDNPHLAMEEKTS